MASISASYPILPFFHCLFRIRQINCSIFRNRPVPKKRRIFLQRKVCGAFSVEEAASKQSSLYLSLLFLFSRTFTKEMKHGMITLVACSSFFNCSCHNATSLDYGKPPGAGFHTTLRIQECAAVKIRCGRSLWVYSACVPDSSKITFSI